MVNGCTALWVASALTCTVAYVSLSLMPPKSVDEAPARIYTARVRLLAEFRIESCSLGGRVIVV